MLISSMFDYLSPSTNSSSKGWHVQGQSIADAIKQANSDAAAKRKALAQQRLKMLEERLRVLMLLSSADRKHHQGNIDEAAGIAKEIAATVTDYAGASADIAQANGGSNGAASSGMSSEDEAFLNTAVQLSSQVKSFIANEIQKAKHKHQDTDDHQGDINVMDNAIIDAAKSLGYTPPQPVSVISLSASIISTVV